MTGAYELGQQAFNDPRNENPYALGTDEYDDWEDGYQEQWDAYCEHQNWGGE
jgi:hypothetical protein